MAAGSVWREVSSTDCPATGFKVATLRRVDDVLDALPRAPLPSRCACPRGCCARSLPDRAPTAGSRPRRGRDSARLSSPARIDAASRMSPSAGSASRPAMLVLRARRAHQHAHAIAARRERARDGRADEAGRAGDEDGVAHGSRSLRAARRPSSACQSSSTGTPMTISRARLSSDTARPISGANPNSGISIA